MSAKKQLEFTARAFRNIAAAEEYIARDNPAAAKKVVQAIFNTAVKLESFPEVGKPGRVPGTRELPLSEYPYTLIYRIKTSRLIVYAVLHQSRQYP
jgi:addiction module RelE/StbE family toxin